MLPNSLTSLGEHLFDGCTALKNVTINNTQQTITSYMFRNCTALEEITLPDTVTTIQGHAFEGCTALKTIHWSKSLNQINSYAFENCEALEQIDVPATVTSVGEGAFYNCNGLKKATIPDSVISFGKKVFYDCDALANVSLGTGLTALPESAFEHCDVLEALVVPYNVATIGKNCFKDSVKFAEITIPRATTKIDKSAFSYPDKLTIYGVGGTYAETFAKENSIKFVDKQVAATQVTLPQKEVTLSKGASQKLILTVAPENTTDLITWKSSDTKIATVSDDGTVKAVGTGSATIKVTVGSVSATCKVTVVQAVTSISLNKTSVSLDAAGTFQLKATAYPSDAGNREIEWSSSAPDVASVDNTGLVTAHAKGSAIITAKAKDGSGVTKDCTVTVANSAFVAKSVSDLESEHNYPNNCSDLWIYTIQGAAALDVTFDSRTDIEEGFDYLYLYDYAGNEIGKYTGTVLAGKTITITGNTVKIKLVSDKEGNTWGFKVSSVTKNEEQSDDPIPEPDPTPAPQTKLTATKLSKVTVKKNMATVTWKKNTTGKGYQLQYSTDKKFKKSVKTVKISKNKTVKTTVKKLKKGTWYFRIRTVKGKKYSGWSAVKKVKVAK